MSREFDEESDLNLVKDYLEGSGLNVERYSKEEMKARKTPDFRVLRDDQLFAHCEVKSPQGDDWLDDLHDPASPGEIVGGGMPDPIFNRISGLVKKAVDQFDAVNPDREKPNILVLVNHDTESNFHDLVETLTGHFYAADGNFYPTMLKIAQGRMIGERKHRVDLFIWTDMTGRHPTFEYFFGSDRTHLDNICSSFEINKKNIRRHV